MKKPKKAEDVSKAPDVACEGSKPASHDGQYPELPASALENLFRYAQPGDLPPPGESGEDSGSPVANA